VHDTCTSDRSQLVLQGSQTSEGENTSDRKHYVGSGDVTACRLSYVGRRRQRRPALPVGEIAVFRCCYDATDL